MLYNLEENQPECGAVVVNLSAIFLLHNQNAKEVKDTTDQNFIYVFRMPCARNLSLEKMFEFNTVRAMNKLVYLTFIITHIFLIIKVQSTQAPEERNLVLN